MDTSTLPPPNLIKPLDYEAVFARLLSRARNEVVGWDAALESDPVLKLLEIVAYEELILRARINDAAASNLLGFAQGSDLDQLALFYAITRLTDESDQQLRARLLFAIAALAGNGTREQYIARALAADTRVIDAAVFAPKRGLVKMAVWIKDPLATDEVLLKLNQALNAEDTRILGIDVAVYAALHHILNIAARITPEPRAAADLLTRIHHNVQTQCKAFAKLGRDCSLSQITSWLQIDGVAQVDLLHPTASITVADDALVSLGDVSLTLGAPQW